MDLLVKQKCLVFIQECVSSQSLADLFTLAVEDDAVILGLEPLHGIVLDESVGESNSSCLLASVTDIEAWSSQDDVEVHTVDTDAWVILDTKINVLLHSKTKVSVF